MRAGQVLLGIVLGVAALLGAWGLFRAVVIAWLPWPIEYREGVMVLSTRLLLEGRNPYAMAQQPVHLNVYGIAFPLLAWPFAVLFGASFATLRALATALVVAGGAATWWVLRRDGVGRALAATGALVVVFHFSAGMSVAARPDSLGWLLFWLCLTVPWRFGDSTVALAAAALLGIAALLAKPYFVFALPLLVAWLVLHRDLARGMAFGVSVLLLLGASVFAVDALLPAYFTDTFFIHLNSKAQLDARPAPAHLLANLAAFLLENAGLFVALALAALAAWRVRGREPAAGCVPTAWWRRGLLASLPGLRRLAPLPFPAFALAGCTLLMVTELGWNVGNGMLYYDQLLVPFLVWTTCRTVERAGRSRLALAALAVGLLANLLAAPPLPERDVAAWDHLRGLVSRPGAVFHPPPLAVAAADAGKEVWDNGHTQYCVLGSEGNSSRVGAEYRERCRAHSRRIAESIAAGAFDLMVVPSATPLVDRRALASRYRRLAQLPMPTLFPGLPAEVWVRRESVRASPAARR